MCILYLARFDVAFITVHAGSVRPAGASLAPRWAPAGTLPTAHAALAARAGRQAAAEGAVS